MRNSMATLMRMMTSAAVILIVTMTRLLLSLRRTPKLNMKSNLKSKFVTHIYT